MGNLLEESMHATWKVFFRLCKPAMHVGWPKIFTSYLSKATCHVVATCNNATNYSMLFAPVQGVGNNISVLMLHGWACILGLLLGIKL